MKKFIGKVISTKMDKTATVAVERIVSHPIYKKRFKRVKRYQVHDEFGTKVGQTVRFIDSKPYSKTKKWKIVEVVRDGEEKPASIKDVGKSKKSGRKGSKKKST